MDELELLKKDWQRKADDYPKVSTNDIYKMIHSKSSSIVKWIFIISLIELGLGLLLALLNPNIDTKIHLPEWTQVLSYASFPIIIYFIYRFYMNYKNISVTDNVTKLMDNIFKTRRTVKYYVLFNILFGAIVFSVGIYANISTNPDLSEKMDMSASSKEYLILLGTIAFATLLFVALVLVIYYLLYGLLLRRLNKNYKELQKLDS